MRSPQLALIACAAVALVVTGCAEETPDPTQDPPSVVRLYGTDGTMQDAFADGMADPTLLAGMKGTAPLNELSPVFTNRLLEIDSSLGSPFLYAGQAYDAVVISALAAELAGTPDPDQVRGYIPGVTTGGQECDTVADCLELARDGADLQYRGVTLRGGFTDAGEPSVASYGTQHFGVNGQIDPDKTEFVGAGDESAATTAAPPEPGGRPSGPEWEIEPLKLGGLLPQTGDLSFAYPPIRAGAVLAVAEINEAGGVFGTDVEWVDGDDGTDNLEIARATVASHVEEGVHIIIGAAASDMTEAILPDVVAARRILFTPTSTRYDLMSLDHQGYLFRTAPSDLLQGAALADIILRDGVERIVVVARDDAYGLGLRDNTIESLQRFGVPPADIVQVTYPAPEEGEPIAGLAGLVDQITAATPDGVLVIGFAEAAQVIQAMVDAGMPITR